MKDLCVFGRVLLILVVFIAIQLKSIPYKVDGKEGN